MVNRGHSYAACNAAIAAAVVADIEARLEREDAARRLSQGSRPHSDATPAEKSRAGHASRPEQYAQGDQSVSKGVPLSSAGSHSYTDLVAPTPKSTLQIGFPVWPASILTAAATLVLSRSSRPI